MATSILSPGHVAFLLLVVLLLFGAKRLPELGESLGSSMRAFRDSIDGRVETRSAQLPAPGEESESGSSQSEQRPPVRDRR